MNKTQNFQIYSGDIVHLMLKNNLSFFQKELYIVFEMINLVISLFYW